MASYGGKVDDEAFVTLATNDIYTRGAMVLAESLKMKGTTRQLVVMITPQVSPPARSALENVFDVVRVVDVMDSKDAAHLALLKRPELGITFTKIHCWTLTEYKKCIFMDADMMAIQNVDELFEREELSAARDSGWPDIFNSGLFVFRPSMETFNDLLQLAETEGSFDGGDQGLLNTFFSDWSTGDISRHLPFLYNLHVSSSYTYLPAFKKFGKDTKVVHFLGPVKPWHHVYNRSTGGVQQAAGPFKPGISHFPLFLSEWWTIYNEKCQKYFEGEQGMKSNFRIQPHHPKEQFSRDKPLGGSNAAPTSRPLNRNRPNWVLPNTFFKLAPSYTEPQYDGAGEVETGDGPRIEVTPPTAGIMENPPLSPAMLFEMKSSVLEGLQTDRHTNSKVKPHKKDRLHGDPNIFAKSSSFPFPNPVVERDDRENRPRAMSESSSLQNISVIPSALVEPEPQPQEPSTSSGNSTEATLRSKWEHKNRWERGEIDYQGVDKFENIQALLDTYL